MRASRLASATAEALPERMRAVLVPSFGAPAVLRLADDLPLPRLEAHEVLVRVGAAGVNPLDCRVRAGYGRSLFGPLLPLVLGREFCGRVASLGAGVRDVVLGSRVFGALSPLVPRGSHARYVAVPACDLAPVPETWSDAHAASLPFAALTAWRALHGGGCTAASLARADVLVLGAGGAVGAAAVQLAVAAGARVHATAGQRSRERVLSYGAASVGGSHTPLCDSAASHAWPSFHLVVDTVGGSEPAALALCRPQGRFVTLHGGAVTALDTHGLILGAAAAAAQLMARKAEVARTHGGVSYSWAVMRPDDEAWASVADLASQGQVRPHLGRVLPWESAVEAHELVESGAAGGKVVLSFEEDE